MRPRCRPPAPPCGAAALLCAAPWLLQPASGARCTAGSVQCAAGGGCCGIVACPTSGTLPYCRQCTAAQDCSAHATDPIGGDGLRCFCESSCRNSWSERDCSVCLPPLGGLDCDGCVSGMVGCAQGLCAPLQKPQCRACGVARDCSNHATAVTSNGYMCVCTCRNGWTGADANSRLDCSKCVAPLGHGPLKDCDACATGYTMTGANAKGVATCQRCVSPTHCSAHDVPGSLSSDGVNCCCTCRNAWLGALCDVCPAGYGGADCDECAPGAFGRYPLCFHPTATVIGGELNGTILYRKHVNSSARCPANRTSVDWVVECGEQARSEASFFYRQRVTDTELLPLAVFYRALDPHAREHAGDAVPCLEKVWPVQLVEDPGQQHDVEVCRLASAAGLLAEFAAFPQTCRRGVNYQPFMPQVARVDPQLNYPPSALGWPGVPGPVQFASVWQGMVRISREGNHTFSLSSDDSSRLWIDGQLVVDNAIPQPATDQCRLMKTQKGWVSLSAGLHTVVVKHFQFESFAAASLLMQGPTTCGVERALRPWETTPIPTYFLWRTTPTPTMTVSPTQTAPPLCMMWPIGSTICVDAMGDGSMVGTPWLLLLVPLVVLLAVYFCRHCANKRRRAQPPAAAVPKEPEADPGALPDEDGPGRGVDVSITVRRVTQPAAAPVAARAAPPAGAGDPLLGGRHSPMLPPSGSLQPPAAAATPQLPAMGSPSPAPPPPEWRFWGSDSAPRRD